MKGDGTMFFKKAFRLIVLFLIIAAGLFVYSGYEKYRAAARNLPVDKIYATLSQKENYTEIADISQTLADATVCVEDRRFYKHNGVDVIGMLRALVYDVRTKSLAEGGSTITQQLAKNVYFAGDNSPTRKIAEIFAAADIEKTYTKEQILEMYFNAIYYGSGCYCVYDAAMTYFAETPASLSDAQATLLAGVPNAPSVYSPKENPSLSYKRREKVLSAMVRDGALTRDEATEIGKTRNIGVYDE